MNDKDLQKLRDSLALVVFPLFKKSELHDSQIKLLDDVMALFTTLLAERERKARLEEVRNMPHQYDPKLNMHVMSHDKIPQPTSCSCYKGRRLAQLQPHKEDKV